MMGREVGSWANFQDDCLRDGFTRCGTSRGGQFVKNKMSSILVTLNLGSCGMSRWDCTGSQWKY